MRDRTRKRGVVPERGGRWMIWIASGGGGAGRGRGLEAAVLGRAGRGEGGIVSIPCARLKSLYDSPLAANAFALKILTLKSDGLCSGSGLCQMALPSLLLLSFCLLHKAQRTAHLLQEAFLDLSFTTI